MDRKAVFAVLVLLGIVLVSGCTGPADEEAGAVKASAGEWLVSEHGKSYFPGGIVEEPMRVWKEGEVFYWIVPIKNSNGLYIGNLITDKISFASPKQIVEYKEPRDRILNHTMDEAYQQMIAESGYPAYQISKPILVAIEGEGLSWYSEVKVNNEVVDKLYVETFTLF